MPNRLRKTADIGDMGPWQGAVATRLAAACAAVFACLLLFGGASASANESAWPTAQARAYNFDFVPYLDPPAEPAAVCLVDSGVNVTPDTPADSPDGPILERLALDGGPGTAASSAPEGLHGTEMAFVGSAPINGWGTVGVWPGARIVSIRAMPVDGTVFPFDSYQRAIDICGKRAEASDIVAVNFSLDCDCLPTAEEQSRLDIQVRKAHSNGMSVVAAAGNSAGAVGNPANEPGIFAVAAGDQRVGLCSFSNRGSGVDLVAPGCETDLVDPISGELWSNYASGTSGASMTTSVVLALLRSYRPDVTWEGAEELVTNAARPTADGPVLDVDALFRNAGLDALVAAARARMPSPPLSDTHATTSGGDAPSSTPRHIVAPDRSRVGSGARPTGRPRYPAPKIEGLLHRGRRLLLSVSNRPAGAQLAVVLERRRGEFHYARVATVRREADTVTMHMPQRHFGAGRFRLQYIHRGHPGETSPTVYRQVSG
jgi:hypothetical protein